MDIYYLFINILWVALRHQNQYKSSAKKGCQKSFSFPAPQVREKGHSARKLLSNMVSNLFPVETY